MNSDRSAEFWNRFDDRIGAWQITVESVAETEGSVLAFGRRDDQPVVLKVIKDRCEEWRSGAILDAFDGRGTVQVYEYVDGAMLLERLDPGLSLARLASAATDDLGTALLAQTIRKMSPRKHLEGVPTVNDWGKGFERYMASGDPRIPRRLVAAACRIYSELCGSQTHVRLLHGDLHQGNVLLDSQQGWLAIDPKGVIGELEYEVGAALRNPHDKPELFADPTRLRKRVERFERELGLDPTRVLSWTFAQAVLAAIWAIEDGLRDKTANGWVALAETIRQMIRAGSARPS
jgi:streptomycin 6-kinase